MAPKIVKMSEGVNHIDFSKTQNRLMRGASWKKQRIIVIVPADDRMSPKVAFSWWNLGFPPNNGVCKLLAQGMEVGEAYSNTIEAVLQDKELSKWEYILTIEHDNIPPADGIIKLLETLENNKKLSAVSGLYFTKGENGVAQIWGDINDPVINFRPQVPIPNTIQECYGIGMGFALWRLSMFKDTKLRRPWFRTIKGNEGFATQDLFAWNDFRKYGYKCAVDTNVKVGHHDIDTDIIW